MKLIFRKSCFILSCTFFSNRLDQDKLYSTDMENTLKEYAYDTFYNALLIIQKGILISESLLLSTGIEEEHKNET